MNKIFNFLLVSVLIVLSNSVKIQSQLHNTSMQKPSNQYYVLTFQHSGKCVDIAGGQGHNGARAIQWDCHGGDNQKFKMVWNDDGTVFLVAKHSGRVLDVEGAYGHNGAAIHQWDLHYGNNQRWYVMSTDSGHFLLKSKNSGRCLDVEGGYTHNGAKIHQWDCHWGGNQRVGFILTENN